MYMHFPPDMYTQRMVKRRQKEKPWLLQSTHTSLRDGPSAVHRMSGEQVSLAGIMLAYGFYHVNPSLQMASFQYHAA